ncbi:hypothetical protein B9G55_14685 [Saccharibacillus sp. O16]|nr:hypothetical protein B9G55_14685 [Saccharibacillus sp. O16]
MKNGVPTVISACILGVSFVSGALIHALLTQPASQPASQPPVYSVESKAEPEVKEIMNEEEAAAYLNITVTDLKEQIRKDNAKRSNQGVSNMYEFIPYATLNDSDLIFYRASLNKWIEFITHNQS